MKIVILNIIKKSFLLTAETDPNFVMAGDGRWIEIQATAEGKPYSDEDYLAMMALAKKGCGELFTLWNE